MTYVHRTCNFLSQRLAATLTFAAIFARFSSESPEPRCSSSSCWSSSSAVPVPIKKRDRRVHDHEKYRNGCVRKRVFIWKCVISHKKQPYKWAAWGENWFSRNKFIGTAYNWNWWFAACVFLAPIVPISISFHSVIQSFGHCVRNRTQFLFLAVYAASLANDILPISYTHTERTSTGWYITVPHMMLCISFDINKCTVIHKVRVRRCLISSISFSLSSSANVWNDEPFERNNIDDVVRWRAAASKKVQ